MDHKPDCRCMSCHLSWARMELIHRNALKKLGWYGEFIIDEIHFPNKTNYHTHGIRENFHHPDFQICFPTRPEICHEILIELIEKIKSGIVFEAGEKLYDGILGGGYKLKFIEAEECSRKVLRLILPNPQHGYTGSIYEAQFTILK